MFTAQNSPWSTATRYSVYRPVLAVPNKVFNVILYVYYGRIWRFGCGLALNREQNDSLSFIILETRTAKLVIRFGVRSFLSRGYFLRYSHLAIPAKLHGPKGDRINESLLYLLCVVSFVTRLIFSNVVDQIKCVYLSLQAISMWQDTPISLVYI